MPTSRGFQSQRRADQCPGSYGEVERTFNKERADWETEKAGLTKKAEDTEAALKPVVEELTSLKRQINAMTSAVFGKCPLVQFF